MICACMSVPGSAEVQYREAESARDSGDHHVAAELFERAAVAFDLAGEPVHQAAALTEAGRSRHRLLDPREAVHCYDRAAQILRNCEHRDSRTLAKHLVRVLTNLGQALHDLGEPETAMTTFEEALRLAGELDELEYAWVANSVGRLYRQLGRPTEARRLLSDAYDVFGRRDRRRDAAHAANNLGAVCNDLGEHDASIAYFEAARQAYVELGDGRYAAMTEANLARQHLVLGNLDAGLKAIEGALSTLDDPESSVWNATALQTKSHLQWETGMREQALVTLLQAAAIFERVERRFEHATTMGIYAGRVLELGRFDEGLEHAERTLQELEQMHDGMRGEELRADFLDHISAVYAALVASYVEAGRHEDAFAIAERAKARTLALLVVQLTDTPIEEEHALVDIRREIGALRDALAPGAPRTDADARRRLERRADELRLALRSIEARLGASVLATPRNPGAASASARAGVPRATLLLEYVVGAGRSSLIAKLGDVIESHPLPASEVLEREIQALRHHMDLGIRSPGANALYRMLLKPVEHLLDATDELLIVPDGALHDLPFAALLRRKPTPGAPPATHAWLVRTHAIRYVHSVQVAAALAARQTQRSNATEGRIAAFAVPEPGDVSSAKSSAGVDLPADALRTSARIGAKLEALPFTLSETERICRALGYGGAFEHPMRVNREAFTIRSDVAATKRAVTDAAAQRRYRYWHFACHGLVDPELADHSGLLLARTENDEDAYWRAYEIAQAQLPCELATLSACETGLGRKVHGEGVLGLARSFIRAGADSVCVSLWQIGDEHTADLMDTFYRSLGAGEGKARSLQRAQLTSVACNIPPSHWSAFVLVGAE